MYLATRFLKVLIFLFGCSRSDEEINSTNSVSLSSMFDGTGQCFSDMQSPINITRTGETRLTVGRVKP